MKTHLLTYTKLFLLLLPAFFSCTKDRIAPEQAEIFIKFFGNSNQDQGSDVIQLPADGGYVLTGTTTLPGGHQEMVVVKTDRFGNQEWYRYYGGGANDQGRSLQLASDGGLILLGTTEDTVSGKTNIMLVKTIPGTEGEPAWTRIIGRTGNQKGNHVQVLDEGYVITGSTDENGDLDILVVKTDLEGNISGDANSWYFVGGYNALTGNGLDDEGNFIIPSADGYGFIVVGTATPGASNNGKDIIVVAVSANGVGWSNLTFGGADNDEGTGIVHVSGNDYVISGISRSGASSRAFLHRLTIDRENIIPAWPQPVIFDQESKNIEIRSLCLSPGGGYVLAGSVLTSPGNNDIFTVMTDPDGQPVPATANNFGGSGNEYAFRIIPASEGGYALIGSTGIPEDNNRMIALIKLNSRGSLSN